MADTFGFDEFIDALGDLEEEFKKDSNKLLEETGDLGVAETQMRTPVDTGTLRRSFTRSDVRDLEVEIGTSIEYAKFVEEGHSTRSGGFVKGKHMLRDGVTIAEKHFNRKSEEVFNKVTKGFSL